MSLAARCCRGQQEENREKGPRWSWARNQMGNVNLDKILANLWRRKKIRKTSHVYRGQTVKWEIPI
jgi:hypothetical protein